MLKERVFKMKFVLLVGFTATAVRNIFSHMKRNLNMNVYCTVHNVAEMAVFFRNFKRLMRYLL